MNIILVWLCLLSYPDFWTGNLVNRQPGDSIYWGYHATEMGVVRVSQKDLGQVLTVEIHKEMLKHELFPVAYTVAVIDVPGMPTATRIIYYSRVPTWLFNYLYKAYAWNWDERKLLQDHRSSIYIRFHGRPHSEAFDFNWQFWGQYAIKYYQK